MKTSSAIRAGGKSGGQSDQSKLRYLRALERKIFWLATWMIHNANHLRQKPDGLKVGGHQASSASLVSIMTALYFDVLRPQDRVAVKPHASPVYHAIQYLLGRQSRDKLENFRSLGGAQAYPSRTKDADDVDFSTGSEGMGAAITIFSALAQEYVNARKLADGETARGRMIAVVGDAELDEGNLVEALLESWKHDVRNVWWIIDYNRQSLDRVIEDRTYQRIEGVLRTLGWDVVELKYGKQLHNAFAREGCDALLDWINYCTNSLYSALVYKGGAAWRQRLGQDLGKVAGISSLLNEYDDTGLAALMTNLAGHDLESLLEAFHGVSGDTPTCFLAYTIKGFGLPFAGHKDNHSALTTAAQIEALKRSLGIADGEEWELFAGLDVPLEELRQFIGANAFAAKPSRRYDPSAVTIPPFSVPSRNLTISTQEGFGRILSDIARSRDEFAGRVVTTSPDVTLSTNLGGWVNRRGVFSRRSAADEFREAGMTSIQRWIVSPDGQHIELGIAENNFFLMLAALGLSSSLFNARLFPIGTVYDTFIGRGLDALNYGCYQDARFMLVGTPSGISLAPEGGAHQSSIPPLIGIGQPNLTSFEPCFVDELAVMMRWSFEHLQERDGGSVYLRLSTRRIQQPDRAINAELERQVIEGGYWLVEPEPGAKLGLVCTGAVVPEVMAACEQIREDINGAGLLVVTSADRLFQGWLRANQTRGGAAPATSHLANLLARLAETATLVSICDAHPLYLSWLGGIGRYRMFPLGVDRFGQSGDIPDLFAEYRIDTAAIIDAVARLCLEQR